MSSGRARSTTEMRFSISLAACPGCGTRVDPADVVLEGRGDAWAFTGNCHRCRTPLGFAFVTSGDPVAAPVPPGELGGPAPSEIVRPGELLSEIDRIVVLVRTDLTQLDADAWHASRDANARLLVCLNELAKFVPEGATDISDDRLSPDERADRAARPERYQRAWIDETRTRHRELSVRIVADSPRIAALEPRVSRSGDLDHVALRAHQAWVERGQNGPGRLVLVGARLPGERVGAAELSGARLERVDFTGIDLSYAALDGAELVDALLTGANLTATSFRGARLRGGSFANGAMALATFERAVVDGTSLSGSDLDRSQWEGAKVTAADLDHAKLGNAELDGAVFARCSFHGADFSQTTPGAPSPTTRGTRFENCDLRGSHWDGRDLSGASFVRCKLDGITGRPAAVEDIVIDLPDLSVDGDGSDVGIASDVLDLWGHATSS